MSKHSSFLKVLFLICSITIFLQSCNLENLPPAIAQQKVTTHQAAKRTFIRKAKRNYSNAKTNMPLVPKDGTKVIVIEDDSTSKVAFLKKEEVNALKIPDEKERSSASLMQPAKRKREQIIDLTATEEETSITASESIDTDGPLKKKTRQGKLNFLDLPTELLEEVVSYLSYKEAMITRELNHHFYSLITGYEQVGKVGVDNKPDRSIPQAKWSSIKQLDFKKYTNKLSSMPSFIFYQFLREVKNLPPIYWPYLADTQVHTVNLSLNKIGCEGVALLGKCLQSSKVRAVLLWSNLIKAKGAQAFAKSLAVNKTIRKIDLSSNQLQAAGAAALTKHLPKQIKTIHLTSNQIKDEGAIEVAKNIKLIELDEMNLERNRIGDKGIIGIIENIQSSLLKRIYLGGNEITDKGIIEMSDKLKNTILEEISLVSNKITNKGALALIKGCQGTNIQKINLSHNKGITDEGILEVAKELEGTQLEEIGLKPINLLKRETQALLREQYPHIKWIFS
ncbi:F-box protein [Candidatus Amoebophilus asiaticus]|uniref:F-box protein n=1 Tax=Candidatus Amoebophilus asiaticus TaxID=281120 RepID=UPI0001715DB1|nr:F-box protein [Candidatus Amoebophilus asiaticus]